MISARMICSDLGPDKSAMKQIIGVGGKKEEDKELGVLMNPVRQERAEVGKEKCSLYATALKKGWVGLLLQ